MCYSYRDRREEETWWVEEKESADKDRVLVKS